MLSGQTLLYAFYVLAAASAILGIEALYVTFSRGRTKSRATNRRLRRLAEEGAAQATLQGLLQERGLNASGDFASRFIALNRLYTQSGVTGSPNAFFLMFVAAALMIGILLRLFGFSVLVTVISFGVIAILLPLFYLRRARKKRIRAFERQLPDTLEMIVRSLRAGHPTTVAVNLVAREMPDPIGTEFGIVSDEITFGQSLEQAVRKLAERVGFEGLNLLSVSLSIQSKTGGNLTEILSNLSGVLRERQRLAMKIRSLSAEGRLSAIMISFFPLVMFAILNLIAPSYYREVWDSPAITPVFLSFAAWALLGDFIMYRMVNFDY